MKTNPLRHTLAAASLLMLATACVENGYDLSDIDTTTRISVNDLTIPVNIDAVTLGDIITYDENSKIRPVTIGGREFYALTETGSFDSKPIEIDEVSAPAPHMNPTEAWLDKLVPDMPAAPAAIPAVSYLITPMGNDIHYNAGEVDEAIVDLFSAQTDITFTITMSALNVTSEFDHVDFTGVVIQMPKGMTATCTAGYYEPISGRWTIPSATTATNSISVSLHATAVNFKTAGAAIDERHQFAYDGEFRVLEGTVTFTANEHSMLPTSLHFRVDYALTDLVATAFSGTMNYKLEGIDIAPVSLGDVPDFLSGEGTDLVLANPQIYLGVNNPVADDYLMCATGITLTAMRDDLPSFDFTPDVNYFTVDADHGVDGPYNFALAPDMYTLTPPAEYADDHTFVQFTRLGSLLAVPEGLPATAGLPDKIGITLNDPQIPEQFVENFALGRSLPGVRGTYELMAPLALGAGSMIVYRDTVDGWNDEDVDAITIERLSLTVTVDNGCPLDADLYAWPIGIDGKRIEGVELRSSHLTALTDGQAATIEMTGKIQHLDGVIFEARVAGDSPEALTPAQSIVLKNIRAKVTGYYEKEL